MEERERERRQYPSSTLVGAHHILLLSIKLSTLGIPHESFSHEANFN
jgi:hypothetical protein